jgi:hypothetical protein
VTTTTPDAAVVATPDASATAEDLDMQLGDFASIQGLTMVSAGYSLVNKNHMTDALAVANSATGGKFPVGTIILNPGANGTTIKEYSVKRRAGFNATTDDWEYFRVQFRNGTPTGFAVRESDGPSCWGACHAGFASQFDFLCEHK